jgi:hypothetical protein
MLICHGCGVSKPDDCFPKNERAANRRGRFHNCRDCVHAHYVANRDRHRRSTRANHVKKRYGMSLDEYDRLIANGCTVCGEVKKRIVMDHCHATDAVRAPLCNGCNVALGAAGDDPVRLRALADYVERHAVE